MNREERMEKREGSDTTNSKVINVHTRSTQSASKNKQEEEVKEMKRKGRGRRGGGSIITRSPAP